MHCTEHCKRREWGRALYTSGWAAVSSPKRRISVLKSFSEVRNPSLFWIQERKQWWCTSHASLTGHSLLQRLPLQCSVYLTTVTISLHLLQWKCGPTPLFTYGILWSYVTQTVLEMQNKILRASFSCLIPLQHVFFSNRQSTEGWQIRCESQVIPWLMRGFGLSLQAPLSGWMPGISERSLTLISFPCIWRNFTVFDRS